MPIELRPFDGDPSDLSALIDRAWGGRYRGEVWYPIWSENYLRWRVLDPRLKDQVTILSAFDAGALIGCIVTEETQLRIDGRTMRGGLTSYLSVDPANPHRGLAARLIERLRSIHLDREIKLSLGVTHSHPGSKSKEFWDLVQRRYPGELTYLGGYRMWTRVVDAEGVAKAGVDTFQRLAPRLAAIVPWGRGSGAGRPADESDIDNCARALDASQATADIAMLWSRERLALQLFHAGVRTAVREAGSAFAVAAGYLADWQGEKAVRVGFVEIAAATNGDRHLAALISSLVRRLSEAGAQMVVAMDRGVLSTQALLAAGFLPQDPHVEAMALFNFDKIDLSRVKKVSAAFT